MKSGEYSSSKIAVYVDIDETFRHELTEPRATRHK